MDSEPGLGQRCDLDDPQQVGQLVCRFYAKVDVDELLGPMFNDVAGVDWPEHLVKLTAFWSRALLGIQGYQGNPFRAHALVNARRSFTVAQFERWLSLFAETLEEGWEGPRADQAIRLARKVAQVHARQLIGEVPISDGMSA